MRGSNRPPMRDFKWVADRHSDLYEAGLASSRSQAEPAETRNCGRNAALAVRKQPEQGASEGKRGDGRADQYGKTPTRRFLPGWHCRSRFRSIRSRPSKQQVSRRPINATPVKTAPIEVGAVSLAVSYGLQARESRRRERVAIPAINVGVRKGATEHIWSPDTTGAQ